MAKLKNKNKKSLHLFDWLYDKNARIKNQLHDYFLNAEGKFTLYTWALSKG